MSPMRTLTCCAVLGLGLVTAWPIKTDDPSNNGANCDTSKEQYLQVEAYDFHDHPRITMRWTQISGICGAPLGDDEEPFFWEGTYDSIDGGDAKPNEGRVQLNGFVCAPFGNYEIELDVTSYSDAGSTMQQRTAWEIENGPDEYHIWDTVNTNLADDILYSPKVPGTYTWPLPGATGYYEVLYAGPLPIIECESSTPSGTTLEGCYTDSARQRTFSQDTLVLSEQGPDGMTAAVCSDYCKDYDYFGTENGSECFCGTAAEFATATTSTVCGAQFSNLCTGDSTAACGGYNAISIYKNTGDLIPTDPYTLAGCFTDSKSSRVMPGTKQTSDAMTPEVCYGLCNDGTNTHFATQYGYECWCGINPTLTLNGDELSSGECDMPCAGDAAESCGGYNTMTAYEIGDAGDDDSGLDDPYVGCYNDLGSNRAMNAEGKNILGSMTNEVCIAFCLAEGHAYAGTQFSTECWCGSSYDTHGASTAESDCNMPCQGDETQFCGGRDLLSVYST